MELFLTGDDLQGQFTYLNLAPEKIQFKHFTMQARNAIRSVGIALYKGEGGIEKAIKQPKDLYTYTVLEDAINTNEGDGSIWIDRGAYGWEIYVKGANKSIDKEYAVAFVDVAPDFDDQEVIARTHIYDSNKSFIICSHHKYLTTFEREV